MPDAYGPLSELEAHAEGGAYDLLTNRHPVTRKDREVSEEQSVSGRVQADPKVKCGIFWDQFIRPQMIASGVPEDGLSFLRGRYVEDASENYAALMAIDAALDAVTAPARMPSPAELDR